MMHQQGHPNDTNKVTCNAKNKILPVLLRNENTTNTRVLSNTFEGNEIFKMIFESSLL